MSSCSSPQSHTITKSTYLSRHHSLSSSPKTTVTTRTAEMIQRLPTTTTTTTAIAKMKTSMSTAINSSSASSIESSHRTRVRRQQQQQQQVIATSELSPNVTPSLPSHNPHPMSQGKKKDTMVLDFRYSHSNSRVPQELSTAAENENDYTPSRYRRYPYALDHRHNSSNNSLNMSEILTPSDDHNPCSSCSLSSKTEATAADTPSRTSESRAMNRLAKMLSDYKVRRLKKKPEPPPPPPPPSPPPGDKENEDAEGKLKRSRQSSIFSAPQPPQKDTNTVDRSPLKKNRTSPTLQQRPKYETVSVRRYKSSLESKLLPSLSSQEQSKQMRPIFISESDDDPPSYFKSIKSKISRGHHQISSSPARTHKATSSDHNTRLSQSTACSDDALTSLNTAPNTTNIGRRRLKKWSQQLTTTTRSQQQSPLKPLLSSTTRGLLISSGDDIIMRPNEMHLMQSRTKMTPSLPNPTDNLNRCNDPSSSEILQSASSEGSFLLKRKKKITHSHCQRSPTSRTSMIIPRPLTAPTTTLMTSVSKENLRRASTVQEPESDVNQQRQLGPRNWSRLQSSNSLVCRQTPNHRTFPLDTVVLDNSSYIKAQAQGRHRVLLRVEHKSPQHLNNTSTPLLHHNPPPPILPSRLCSSSYVSKKELQSSKSPKTITPQLSPSHSSVQLESSSVVVPATYESRSSSHVAPPVLKQNKCKMSLIRPSRGGEINKILSSTVSSQFISSSSKPARLDNQKGVTANSSKCVVHRRQSHYNLHSQKSPSEQRTQKRVVTSNHHDNIGTLKTSTNVPKYTEDNNRTTTLDDTDTYSIMYKTQSSQLENTTIVQTHAPPSAVVVMSGRPNCNNSSNSVVVGLKEHQQQQQFPTNATTGVSTSRFKTQKGSIPLEAATVVVEKPSSLKIEKSTTTPMTTTNKDSRLPTSCSGQENDDQASYSMSQKCSPLFLKREMPPPLSKVTKTRNPNLGLNSVVVFPSVDRTTPPPKSCFSVGSSCVATLNFVSRQQHQIEKGQMIKDNHGGSSSCSNVDDSITTEENITIKGQQKQGSSNQMTTTMITTLKGRQTVGTRFTKQQDTGTDSPSGMCTRESLGQSGGGSHSSSSDYTSSRITTATEETDTLELLELKLDLDERDHDHSRNTTTTNTMMRMMIDNDSSSSIPLSSCDPPHSQQHSTYHYHSQQQQGSLLKHLYSNDICSSNVHLYEITPITRTGTTAVTGSSCVIRHPPLETNHDDRDNNDLQLNPLDRFGQQSEDTCIEGFDHTLPKRHKDAQDVTITTINAAALSQKLCDHDSKTSAVPSHPLLSLPTIGQHKMGEDNDDNNGGESLKEQRPRQTTSLYQQQQQNDNKWVTCFPPKDNWVLVPPSHQSALQEVDHDHNTTTLMSNNINHTTSGFHDEITTKVPMTSSRSEVKCCFERFPSCREKEQHSYSHYQPPSKTTMTASTNRSASALPAFGRFFNSLIGIARRHALSGRKQDNNNYVDEEEQQQQQGRNLVQLVNPPSANPLPVVVTSSTKERSSQKQSPGLHSTAVVSTTLSSTSCRPTTQTSQPRRRDKTSCSRSSSSSNHNSYHHDDYQKLQPQQQRLCPTTRDPNRNHRSRKRSSSMSSSSQVPNSRTQNQHRPRETLDDDLPLQSRQQQQTKPSLSSSSPPAAVNSAGGDLRDHHCSSSSCSFSPILSHYPFDPSSNYDFDYQPPVFKSNGGGNSSSHETNEVMPRCTTHMMPQLSPKSSSLSTLSDLMDPMYTFDLQNATAASAAQGTFSHWRQSSEQQQQQIIMMNRRSPSSFSSSSSSMASSSSSSSSASPSTSSELFSPTSTADVNPFDFQEFTSLLLSPRDSDLTTTNLPTQQSSVEAEEEDENENKKSPLLNRNPHSVNRYYSSSSSGHGNPSCVATDVVGGQRPLDTTVDNELPPRHVSAISPPESTLIIWDWDDTILPTYHLAVEHRCSLTDSWVPEPLRQPLVDLERKALRSLRLSMRNGCTILVTNASFRWLTDSASKYFPKLWDFIQKHRIKILSARDICQPLGVPQSDWKRLLIRDQVERFFEDLDVPCTVVENMAAVVTSRTLDSELLQLFNAAATSGSSNSSGNQLSTMTMSSSPSNRKTSPLSPEVQFFLDPQIKEQVKLDRFSRTIATHWPILPRVLAMAGLLVTTNPDSSSNKTTLDKVEMNNHETLPTTTETSHKSDSQRNGVKQPASTYHHNEQQQQQRGQTVSGEGKKDDWSNHHSTAQHEIIGSKEINLLNMTSLKGISGTEARTVDDCSTSFICPNFTQDKNNDDEKFMRLKSPLCSSWASYSSEGGDIVDSKRRYDQTDSPAMEELISRQQQKTQSPYQKSSSGLQRTTQSHPSLPVKEEKSLESRIIHRCTEEPLARHRFLPGIGLLSELSIPPTGSGGGGPLGIMEPPTLPPHVIATISSVTATLITAHTESLHNGSTEAAAVVGIHHHNHQSQLQALTSSTAAAGTLSFLRRSEGGGGSAGLKPEAPVDYSSAVLQIQNGDSQQALVIPSIPEGKLLLPTATITTSFPYVILPEGTIRHIRDMFPPPPEHLGLRQMPCSVVSIGDGQGEREAVLAAMAHWDANHRSVLRYLTTIRTHMCDLYQKFISYLHDDASRRCPPHHTNHHHIMNNGEGSLLGSSSHSKEDVVIAGASINSQELPSEAATAILEPAQSTTDSTMQMLQAPSASWTFKSLKLSPHPTVEELSKTHDALEVALLVCLDLAHSIDASINSHSQSQSIQSSECCFPTNEPSFGCPQSSSSSSLSSSVTLAIPTSEQQLVPLPLPSSEASSPSLSSTTSTAAAALTAMSPLLYPPNSINSFPKLMTPPFTQDTSSFLLPHTTQKPILSKSTTLSADSLTSTPQQRLAAYETPEKRLLLPVAQTHIRAAAATTTHDTKRSSSLSNNTNVNFVDRLFHTTATNTTSLLKPSSWQTGPPLSSSSANEQVSNVGRFLSSLPADSRVSTAT